MNLITRLARLEAAAGAVNCPHCGGRVLTAAEGRLTPAQRDAVSEFVRTRTAPPRPTGPTWADLFKHGTPEEMDNLDRILTDLLRRTGFSPENVG